jgi:predicted acetyltransferase
MSEFGFHLFLESQKPNIQSKNDVLVIFMHWMFVKNKFRNIGIGDNVSKLIIYSQIQLIQ